MFLATKKWREEEGDYRDDITAIVIMLDQMRTYMKEQAANSRMKEQCMNSTTRKMRSDSNIEMPAFPSHKDRRNSATMEAKDLTVPPNTVNSKDAKAKTFRKR